MPIGVNIEPSPVDVKFSDDGLAAAYTNRGATEVRIDFDWGETIRLKPGESQIIVWRGSRQAAQDYFETAAPRPSNRQEG